MDAAIAVTLLGSLSSVLSSYGTYRYIQTTSGKVSGLRINVTEWGEVLQFYGIPYAKSPVGSLRFKPTQPLLTDQREASTAQGIVNTDSNPAACPQTEHLPAFSHDSLPHGGLKIDEDCLKLNIYAPVPELDSKEKLPILIWIPGDGFNYADIIQYDGSALAANGRIIVVTVNYRVGVFGFLSSGGSILPGNAGLHDILNAVKWVRKNAEKFNADENNITLGGRFSGAMAISALVVSPLFLETVKNPDNTITHRSLARRVILHGGIATGRYVLDYKPEIALTQLAEVTHCRRSTINETIICLQNVPRDKILDDSKGMVWRPVFDDMLVARNHDPLSQFGAGKYPAGVHLLIGDNDGAGSLCFLAHSVLNSSELHRFKSDELREQDLQNLIKHSLKEFYALEKSNRIDKLAAVATHEYMFSGISDKPSYRDPYLRFCGAMYIRYPVEFAAQSVARSSNETHVYRYQWAYRPEHSSNPKFLRAAIGDEIIFAFPSNLTKFEDKQDMEMRDNFMEILINFVKRGNPAPKHKSWPRFDVGSQKMINFESGMKPSDSKFLNRDVHFWHNVTNPLAEVFHRPEKPRNCQTVFKETSPSGLSKLMLTVVILMVLTITVVFVYFFMKNWGKPRSLWRF